MRLKNFLGFIIVLALIIAALAIQSIKHLDPCPLCILQRVAFIAMAGVFFIFALLPQRLYLARLQGILLLL